MHIRVLLQPTAYQHAVMAAAKKTEDHSTRLAFYLVALALYIGKPSKGVDLKKVGQTLFNALGSPKDLKGLMAEISKGKVVDDFEIDWKKYPSDLQPLAQAISNTEEVGTKWYEKVCRLSHLIIDPTISKLWRVEPKKPEGIKDPKERNKAMNRYLKDMLINLVREKASTKQILSILDREGKTNEFSQILPRDIVEGVTIDSLGGLVLNGDPLVSRAGSAVTLWVLRGSTIQLPQRSRGEDSYVFAYVPAMGDTPQKVYKQSSVRKANDKKWGAVSDLTTSMPKMQAAWMKLLKAGDPLGALLQFVFLTNARIGTIGNETAGAATFGASTLLVKHVKIKGNTAVIQYPGKKGVVQVHKIVQNPETKPLLDWLRNRLKFASANMTLFSDSERPIPNAAINGWLTRHISGVTVHKFRHLRGTSLALEALADIKMPAEVTQSVANRLFKTAMEKVAHALGHYNLRGDEAKLSSATSIKNYISPEIMHSWFKKFKLEVPNFIPSL